MSTSTTAAELEATLARFSGTERIYRQAFAGNVIQYTDGVRYLAETAQAYWLIDVLHSHQRRAVRLCDGFQLWQLQVNDDRSAIIECRADTGQPAAIRQRIEYTDFPLKQIRLYVVGHTIMLPGEY
jgi:hypothetical protein